MTQKQLEKSVVNPGIMLGDLLIQKRFIAWPQLQAALFKQSATPKRLGQLLVEAGHISQGQLKTTLREQYWRQSGYWVIDRDRDI